MSDALPVAPSLDSTLDTVSAPRETAIVDGRTAAISGMAILLAIVTALAAKVLTTLIAFITNVSFYARASAQPVSPAEHHLGPWVVVVPIAGAIVVGIMARYGSAAIRGHGIPEAMEQVLFNKSRIPPRLTFLKPLSAAISIGTGGPFGAEGPIIATGGALGSLARAAGPDDGARAEDAARGGRRGRDGGDLRQPGVGGAARGRTAALRVSGAIDGPGGAGERRGGGGAVRARRQRRRVRDGNPDATRWAGADRLHRARRRHGRHRDGGDARGVRHRGRLRAPAPALDVVAGDRRDRGGRGRLSRSDARWASATTTSRTC